MQKILSFNTIFSDASIILQNSDKIYIENINNKKQSEILVSSINKVLSNNNLSHNDIDIFSTIIGPGNFTGIKTSLAVLKALQISTNKKIITCDVFEIISYNILCDCIILDMKTVKYYIKNNNKYYIIYKKDINEFLDKNKNLKILTNDENLKNNNIVQSTFSNEKWIELINYKVQNNIFTNEIMPLYIEEASISKRKN